MMLMQCNSPVKQKSPLVRPAVRDHNIKRQANEPQAPAAYIWIDSKMTMPRWVIIYFKIQPI